MTRHKGEPSAQKLQVVFCCRQPLRDAIHAKAKEEGSSVSVFLERIIEEHFAVSELRVILREEIRAAFADCNSKE